MPTSTQDSLQGGQRVVIIGVSADERVVPGAGPIDEAQSLRLDGVRQPDLLPVRPEPPDKVA